MLRMITSEYANGLERYLYADAIRNWCLEVSDKRPWMPLTAQFLKWFEHDHDRSYEIHRAFDAARAITKSWRLRAAAQGYVEDARRQAEPKPDVVLESEPVEAT